MIKIKRYTIVMPQDIQAFWWEELNATQQPDDIKKIIRDNIKDEKETTDGEIQSIIKEHDLKLMGVLTISYDNKTTQYITCLEAEFHVFEKDFIEWKASEGLM